MIWQTGIEMLLTKRPPPEDDDYEPPAEKAWYGRKECTHRKQICSTASAISAAKRAERRDDTKQRFVSIIGKQSLSAEDISNQTGLVKQYVLVILGELLAAGAVRRVKGKRAVYYWSVRA